jgi:eukaryotic-like serine/threonine-protein kinase
VTDFGIARAGASEITQTGSVLGTAQYLSPEQAQGLPVTAASDIYSVGVLLYEALTGRVPFDADSPVSVALKQVSERPRPPSELNPAVSRALDGVVLRALAKDPGNRFASAEEFMQALDVAEQDPSGAAFGDTASYAAVAAAAGTEPPPPPPEEPPEKRRFFTPWRIALLALILLLLAGAAAFFLLRGGGTSDVLVPTVLGKSKDDAAKILTDAGFQVSQKAIPRANTPVGRVIEQDPTAGSRAPKGSVVAITYTIGLGSAFIPDVKGTTKADAEQQLKKAGFQTTIQNQHSSNVKKGSVIGTDPPAGTKLERQKTVTILVSNGPNLVQVPSVVGLDQDTADTQLRDAGLRPHFQKQESSQAKGQVIDQSPSAGTDVRRKSTVTVVVSSGVGKVDVPNVVGESKDQAASDLRAAGLSVRVVKQTTNDSNADGLVISQAPSAGAKLPRGEAVTISVGKFKEPTTTTTTTTTTTSSGSTTP